MPRFSEATDIPIRETDNENRETPTITSTPTTSTSTSTPTSNPIRNTVSTLEPEVPDRIRIRNRRKRYLDMHPEYFGPQLELADPLLYDRLIRRFQSAAEREAEGRKKGYSGILEADLYRSEAKLEALRHPDATSLYSYKRGPDGEILAEERDEVPKDKEEGWARWKWEMETRFVAGLDDDFEYQAVDGSDEWDDRVVEEREVQDRWFDDESPGFVGAEEEEGNVGDSKEPLKGETGVQDF